MNNLVYKKRPGTSGISGQLYETKLLSLILFRVLDDNDIEEFFIGTNVDGLGEFDDICLRFKVKGFDKTVAVFLQAKHRENVNKPLVVIYKDLPKYFDSYLKIRNKFNVNSSDAFFKCAYEDVECVFVYYTNTKDELVKEYHPSIYISKVNDVIRTGDDVAFQLPYTQYNFLKRNKNMVLDFKKRLLFCTNQASESKVEYILVGDIGRLLNTRERNCNFQLDPHDIFEKYHKDIQQWWMQSENPQYLTKTCQLYQNSVEHSIIKSLLSVANVTHKNKMLKLNIKLNTEAVKLLELDALFSKKTIIVSDCIALSVEKVTQYIKTDDYILIDLNYMLSLPVSYYDLFHKKLKNVEGKILILTYRSPQVSTSNKDMKDMLHSLKQKKLIVVTNESLSKIGEILAHTVFFIVKDKSSLVDLTKESQETIIKKTDVIFQGKHVNLDLLVDDGAKVFIKGEVMDKIMSEEVIQVGEPLTNPLYEKIKGVYILRRVTSKRVFHGRQDDNAVNDDDDELNDDDDNSNDERQDVGTKLESFCDIDEHAVLITAEPGMGKSTLLTHLSLTTKARDPGVWIVRINLLDYSRFLNEWVKNKVVIGILEALRFICIAFFKLNINEKFILHEENDKIYLKDCGLKAGILFQINMFLHHYSRRKVIFAFDGFDEICPHYETNLIQFLNILKQCRPREHRIWITSRTYSHILRSLESVFNVCHQLQPFNDIEQQQFIKRYLKVKLDLNELNQKQIEKIDDFIAFMKRTHSHREDEELRRYPYKFRSMPLHTVYLDAAKYFKDEIKRVLCLKDNDKYVEAWNLDVHALQRQYFPVPPNCFEFMHKFVAVPLHIYMVLDYFQNQIKDVEIDTIWDLNLNTYAMYEHFVETKLRKIRFEEKNQMDLYKPDNQFTFESEKTKFMNEHKKLAAYAMFYEHVDQLFSEPELEKIRKTVSTINSGREKTGVIHTVITGVPRFVHLTFAEYFAVEYICDKLKTEQSNDDLKSLWNFIFNTVFYNNNLGLLNVLDDKLIMDVELKHKVSDARSRRIIFDVLMEQSEPGNRFVLNYKTRSSLGDVMNLDLHNLTSLFLSTLEFITPDNVQLLVRMITERNEILVAVIKENTKFINVVLDTVRKADPSQIYMLFCELPGWSERCDGNTPNEVIVDIMNRYIYRPISVRSAQYGK